VEEETKRERAEVRGGGGAPWRSKHTPKGIAAHGGTHAGAPEKREKEGAVERN